MYYFEGMVQDVDICERHSSSLTFHWDETLHLEKTLFRVYISSPSLSHYSYLPDLELNSWYLLFEEAIVHDVDTVKKLFISSPSLVHCWELPDLQL